MGGCFLGRQRESGVLTYAKVLVELCSIGAPSRFGHVMPLRVIYLVNVFLVSLLVLEARTTLVDRVTLNLQYRAERNTCRERDITETCQLFLWGKFGLSLVLIVNTRDLAFYCISRATLPVDRHATDDVSLHR